MSDLGVLSNILTASLAAIGASTTEE